MVTKEQILAKLKERFKGLGFSDARLDRFAIKLQVTVTEEEKIDDEVNKVTGDQIIQSEFDSRVTESNKKAVDNAKAQIIADAYKKAGLDENGKPIEKKEPEENKDVPEYMKKFMADQQKFNEGINLKIDGNTAKQTTEALRAKVIGELDEKKIPKEYYGQLQIDVTDPEKVPEKVVEIVNSFNAVTKASVNQGLTFEKPQQRTIKVEESDIGEYLDVKFPKEKTEK